MTRQAYGGIAREDRIYRDGEAWCDKAWHLPERAAAKVVLRCADCGRVYARCTRCEQNSPAGVSMRAHRASAHRVNAGVRSRVLPREIG